MKCEQAEMKLYKRCNKRYLSIRVSDLMGNEDVSAGQMGVIFPFSGQRDREKDVILIYQLFYLFC